MDANEIRYIFVDAMSENDDRNMKGMDIQYIKMYDTWVFINKFELDNGMLACYVNTDNVWYNHNKAVRAMGALIVNNHTYGYEEKSYNSFYNYVDNYFNRRRLGANKYTWYCECETTTQKITQYHHLHIRPLEALDAARLCSRPIQRRKCPKCDQSSIKLHGEFATLIEMCRSINDVKQTHATFIVYYMSTPRWAQRFLLGLYLVSKDTGYDFIKMLKNEGVCAKQVQGLYRNDMNVIFELQVLVNRLDTSVDWDAEKKNRTEVRVIDVPYDDVYQLATEAFTSAKVNGAKPNKSSWKSYWAQRYSLTPNGAIHSDYQSDINQIRTVPHRYRTKKNVLSTVPNMSFNDLLNRTPEIVAKTSTKYEWGKVRALYGCDLTTHLMADFGMARCEDTLPSWMPVGVRASEDNIVKLMSTMKAGVPVCYDYDDFNSQHSASSMQAVIKAWLDVYGSDLSPEQRSAVDWTYKSVDNMRVHDMIGTQSSYTTAGTLFSGWRLTSFINTVLNWVYLEQAGLSKNVIRSIHNGDDVYAITDTIGAAMKLISNAARMGIRAQLSKMNIGTIAEFLRMDLRAELMSSRQYLSRACSTLVHGRVETSEPNSVLDALEADCERISSMLLRGGRTEYMTGVRKVMKTNLGRVFNLELTDIDKVLKIHRVCGGLSEEKTPPVEQVIKQRLGSENLEVTELLERMKPGFNDYIRYIASLFKIKTSQIDTEQIMNTAARQMTQYKTTITISKIDVKLSSKLVGLYHGWHNLPVLKQLSRARSVTSKIGLAVLDMDSCYKNVLVSTGRPLHWLSILS